eukprot:m.117298 g.117298  ORF g.117298 m.117298 type:complete len:131 (+) comp16396_c0_seq6:420-812(+)
MGMVFGKIDVETPAHKVISTQDGWEHRRYPAAVAAEVSTASFETRADFDNQAFRVLANYIGVFGTPKNKAATTGDEPSAVAMTAPVVSGEQVAMTAPVLSQEVVESAAPEADAMTAPVLSETAQKHQVTL